MTKVARLFEEEKIEAVNEAVNKARREEKFALAKSLLVDGEDYIKVMKYTGLTRAEVDQIRESLKA